MDQPGATNFADTDGDTETGGEAGTEGGTTARAGINGSRARLPFTSTRPARPCWAAGAAAPRRRPACGRPGTGCPTARRADRCSWCRRRAASIPAKSWCSGPPTTAARTDPGGSLGFGDVGASPAWRNLRLPLSAIPDDATRIRLVATDDDLSPEHWIALTPPRISELRSLQDVVGSQDPVLLDWLVGLAFPCQRPFDHRNGVIEVPKWRIMPDRFGAEANSPVMDYLGGGPLGITELLLRPTTLPTYLKDDWFRDWGLCSSSRPTTGTRCRHVWISVPQRVAACGARRRCVTDAFAYHRRSCPHTVSSA